MKAIVLILAMLVVAAPSGADDLEFTTDEFSQEEFDSLVREMGVAISFNPMAPAEPLGTIGFDIGLEVVLTDISDGQGYWTKLVADSNPHPFIPVPRLHVMKGLPFGIDVGAIYAEVPGYDIRLWGLEVKYALLEGSVATPALSIRGSYSQLNGVDDIDLNTQTIDLMISKGVLMLTPYAGVSALWVNGGENSSLVTLSDSNETILRGFVGLQVSPIPLISVNGEVSFGDVVQYGLKVAIRF